MNAGVLNIQDDDGLGTTANGTTVSSGAALEVQGTLSIPAEALTLNGTGISNGGALRNVANTNTLAGAITLGSDARINTDSETLNLDGNIDGAGFELIVGGNGTAVDMDGIVSGSGTAIIKDGSSTLRLDGVNTFTGATYVSNGTVRVTADSGLGTAPGSATAGHLTINGGAFQSAASMTLDSDRGIALGANDGTINTIGGALTYAGIIAGSGDLTKTGSQEFRLSGTSTFTGATIINAGTVRINNDANLGAVPGAPTAGHITMNNGKLYAFNVDVTLNSRRGISLGAGGGSLRVTSGETMTYAGTIAGTGTLTKELTGTLLLIGTNTYTGATTIDSGAIIYNGLNTNSAITVDDGTTLMGIGSVGALTVAGTVAPGTNTIGVGALTVASLTLNDASIFRCQLGDNSDTTDRDYIDNTATATISGISTVRVDSALVSNWDNTVMRSWNIITGGITSTNNFVLDQSTHWDSGTFPFSGGAFSLSAGVNNLVLTFTPTPGPILDVAPTNLAFTAQRSYNPDPASQTYIISNSNAGTLSWTSTVSYSSAAADWLSLTATNGFLGAGEFLVVTAIVTSFDLPRGDYILTNTVVGADSAGTEDVVITLSVTGFSDNVSYDTFNYTAGNGMEGQSGGIGWSGVWTNNSDIEQTPLPYVGSASLASFDNYCNDGGNDAAVDMANCGGAGEAACADLLREAYRGFPEISSGVVYMGFKLKAQITGTGKDYGVSLGDGGTFKVKVGKVDATSDNLGIQTSDGITLTSYGIGGAGSEYLILMRYDLDTGEVKVQGYFGNNLGTEESWQSATRIAPAGSTPLNRMTLFARNGSLGETAGTNEWDDVRIARNWADLLCGLDDAQGVPIVTNVTFYDVDVSNRVSDALLSAGNLPLIVDFYDPLYVVSDNTNSPYFIANFDLVDDSGTHFVQDLIFSNFNYSADGSALQASNSVLDITIDNIPIGTATLRWSAINSNKGYRVNMPKTSDGSNIVFTVYDDDVQGPQPRLIYIGTDYVPGGPIQTNITDADLANTNNLLDIAITWEDASGVFLTNVHYTTNLNIASDNGRVIANWDLFSSNTLSGATNLFGFNQVFTNFFGVNGDIIVTNGYDNAFSITNADESDVFFLTVSGEDEDNDRGTFADPQGDGDPIPRDRTVITNALLRFFVTDDDSSDPICTSFVIEGTGGRGTTGLVSGAELAAGNWTITGVVFDADSGINVNGTSTTPPDHSPYVQLIDPNGVALFIEAFDTLGFGDGGATSASAIQHTSPGAITNFIVGGTWTALVVIANNDFERIGDAETCTVVIPFSVATFEWDAEGGSNRDWSQATNWTGDIEPTAVDTAHINGAYTAVVSVAGESVQNLFVGDNGFNAGNDTGEGNVEQSGGDVDIGNTLVLGESLGDIGRYAISGGSLVVTGVTTIGDSGLGLMTVTGTAAVTVHGNLVIGDGGAGGEAAGSTLAVNGGDIFARAELQVGNSDDADGRIEITGGTLNVTNSSTRIGNISGSTGTVVVSGGLFNVGGNDNTENLFIGDAGYGVLTVSGSGIVSSRQDVVIADDSGNSANSTVFVQGGQLYAGDNIEVGDASGAVGTFNVSGGTVTAVDEIRVGDGSGSTGTMLMSGGTVTMGEEFYVGFSGFGTATISGGSVTALSVVVANNSGAAGSVLNISGGDVVATGDLNVDFSGTVNVSSGSLSVDTIDLGVEVNAVALLNLSGGILTAADDVNISSGTTGGATGIVHQSGGTLSIAAGNPLNIGGQGALGDRYGYYTITNGTINITAGSDNGDLQLGDTDTATGEGVFHLVGTGPSVNVGDDLEMSAQDNGELIFSLVGSDIAAILVDDDINMNGTISISNVGAVAAGEYVVITNTTGTGNINGAFDTTNFIGTITGRVVVADSYVSVVFSPVMHVLGTNATLLIPDGDVTPNLNDGTDYGSVQADTTNSHVFTIRNANGTFTLDLIDNPVVVLGGPNSNQFTVLVQPASTNIGPLSTTTFTVGFTPLVVGTYTATVSIANNDTLATIYDFTIIGNAVLASEPTLNASNLVFSAVTNVSMNVSWNNGNGAKRILVARAGEPVAGLPADGIGYAASAVFGSGDTIAAGEYVLFNDSGTNVTVTGLSICTRYYFALFEYNGSGGGANYLTTGFLQGNEQTLNSKPIITEGASTNIVMSENSNPTAFSLTLNATDADTGVGDVITWSVLNAPQYGTASADATGGTVSVSYTPHPYFSGTDLIVVQAVDNCGAKDTMTIAVTVERINPPGKVFYIFE